MGWLLIVAGVVAVLVSGKLTNDYTRGDAELWKLSATRHKTGFSKVVPTWVSLINIGGWIAVGVGVLILIL